MYVITQHNKIILGPIEWNAPYIASVLQTDLDLMEKPVVLPSDVFKVPYYILPEIYVRNVSLEKPEYNPKIQKFGGMDWRFDEKYAYGSYTVIDKEIDEVKGELKNKAASTRWEKENAGISLDIGGISIRVSTSRDSRRVFLDKYISMGANDSCNWKFDENWITLSKQQVEYIVKEIDSAIQSAFDWEIGRALEIDSCTTLEQLNITDLDA